VRLGLLGVWLGPAVALLLHSFASFFTLKLFNFEKLSEEAIERVTAESLQVIIIIVVVITIITIFIDIH
jgi:hypothetical protein